MVNDWVKEKTRKPIMDLCQVAETDVKHLSTKPTVYFQFCYKEKYWGL